MVPRGRQPARRWARSFLALLLVVAIASALLPFLGGSDNLVPIDADLCPVDEGGIAGRATLLLDLRKPLGDHAGAPVEALQQVARGLDEHSELSVFALAGDAAAPRVRLDRFCKPYDNAVLNNERAKDRRGPSQRLRDCDDLPAQLPPGIRERAAEFCRRRDELADRVAELARRAPTQPVTDAYLVAGLDDARLGLAGQRRPSLYVMSDMMQHASWYSHAELTPTEWRQEDFASVRAERQPLNVPVPADPNLDVTIFYLLRQGVTEHPRIARVHQQFWREYFGPVKALTFAERAAVLSYEVVPLLDRPSARELAALEAERARRDREEAERVLERAAAEQAALERARRDARAEEDQRRARLAALAEERRRPEEDAARQAAGRAGLEAERREIERRTAERDEPPPAPPAAEAPGDPPASAAVTPEAIVEANSPAAPPEANVEANSPAVPPDPPAEPCVANLGTEFATADTYPDGRRADYGAAEVVVAYTIGDDGRTVDDQVSALLDRSTADRPDYLDLFAETAEDTVRGWVFDIEDNGACSRKQRRMTRFRYRYR